MDLTQILKSVENNQEKVISLCKVIWEHPETALEEYVAVQATGGLLRAEGFSVDQGVYGLETALRASWGNSGPVIGILAEYDALDGLSQEVATYKAPVKGQNCGHGCGHNLLCGASVGAAIAIRDYLKENALPGTIVLYGCPAEEGLLGKRRMLENGAFRELDVALAVHPGALNQVVLGPFNAAGSVKYHFFGKSAHAAAEPFLGRSALDAAELMNIGANYLREHVTPDIRLHYTYEGRFSPPNVVPDRASVWYSIRGSTEENVLKTRARVKDIASGAALMTGTQVEEEFVSLCRETTLSSVLGNELDRAMRELPKEPYTESEVLFASVLNETQPETLKKRRMAYPMETGEICTEICPISYLPDAGSTDVGDVSGVVPTGMFFVACYSLGTTAHSWQATACSGHSIGFKGMLFAAKTMALTSARLFRNPQIIGRAKIELQQVLNKLK